MLDKWVEPSYQPILPIKAPASEMFPERADFAFTSKQRQWYLRVYTNPDTGLVQCGFHRYNEERGWYRCEVTGAENIEIHHIQPSGWTQEQEPYNDPNRLSVENNLGIALCSKLHHDTTLHPDIRKAYREYHNNPDSFKEAIRKHKELAKEGIVFWNDEWDEALKIIAQESVIRYVMEHPDDPYPSDPKWARTKHPKKPHWTDIFNY